ncbi:MAG: hypothetical protein KGJ78_11390 [Alphaproteobacteria bacterium]|nr:hypothetical protein [Alphaproteobacteria bacterium]
MKYPIRQNAAIWLAFGKDYETLYEAADRRETFDALNDLLDKRFDEGTRGPLHPNPCVSEMTGAARSQPAAPNSPRFEPSVADAYETQKRFFRQ